MLFEGLFLFSFSFFYCFSISEICLTQKQVYSIFILIVLLQKVILICLVRRPVNVRKDFEGDQEGLGVHGGVGEHVRGVGRN